MFETADLNIVKNMMQKFISDNPHKIKSIELFRELFLSRLESPDLPELDYLISEAEKNVLLAYGTDNYNQIKKNIPRLVRLMEKAKNEKHTFSLIFYTVFAEYFLFEYFASKKNTATLGKKVQIYQMH
jgi:hypothetical protein